MRVQQLAQGILEYEPSSLSLGFKRLRPLAPKLAVAGTETILALDVKSLIKNSRQANYPKANCTTQNSDASLVESQQQHGGTRWNPTQEQIGTLEKLYKGGMRTPNAQQIERITAELGKYGKIEGKNVFYWFQNHKARERQKHKRNLVALNNNISSTLPITTSKEEARKDYYPNAKCKRRCRSWSVGFEEGEIGGGGGRTLELFPLHPEGR